MHNTSPFLYLAAAPYPKQQHSFPVKWNELCRSMKHVLYSSIAVALFYQMHDCQWCSFVAICPHMENNCNGSCQWQIWAYRQYSQPPRMASHSGVARSTSSTCSFQTCTSSLYSSFEAVSHWIVPALCFMWHKMHPTHWKLNLLQLLLVHFPFLPSITPLLMSLC